MCDCEDYSIQRNVLADVNDKLMTALEDRAMLIQDVENIKKMCERVLDDFKEH